MSDRIYHMCPKASWAEAVRRGVYEGQALDRRDGFIHFSTAGQVQKTAALHLRGTEGLVLLEVPADRVGAALRWEPSRDGEPFPHLYGTLDPAAVSRVWDLPVGEDGLHVFPDIG